MNVNDYYPFGMMMPERSYTVDAGYRYGFNGKENDNEVKGVEGSQQDYGMRIYDPRLGRFLSVDPLTRSFSELSPYQYASNTPIQAIDLDGLELFIVRDGREPGIVEIELVNYSKREPEKNLQMVHGQPPATFLVIDLRSSSTSANPEIFFPIKQVQALFGGSFISDAGVVYRMGDPEFASTIGLNEHSAVIITPRPIKMNAANTGIQEKQVLWIAEFAEGTPLKSKKTTSIIEKNFPLIPLDSRYDEFGRGKSSIMEDFIAPVQSESDVTISLTLSDNGTYQNGFTILDASGKTLASFQSTSQESMRTVEFSIKPGDKFSVKVTGNPGNKSDNYSISGSAKTTKTITYLIPDKND